MDGLNITTVLFDSQITKSSHSRQCVAPVAPAVWPSLHAFYDGEGPLEPPWHRGLRRGQQALCYLVAPPQKCWVYLHVNASGNHGATALLACDRMDSK